MSFEAADGFDDMAKLGHFWFRVLAVLLACAATFETIPLTGDQVHVRHMEGLMHGFLALRTLDGKRLEEEFDLPALAIPRYADTAPSRRPWHRVQSAWHRGSAACS